MSNELAPRGSVWVCCACGKMSKDHYGDKAINYGWDVSCIMNSQIFKKKLLVIGDDGRVKEVRSETETSKNSKVPKTKRRAKKK